MVTATAITGLLARCFRWLPNIDFGPFLNQFFPKIVSDGGIRNYSDIIKALALGADYVMCGSIFSKMLERDASFSRTLWLPSIQRYGYSSEQHPAINFQEITKKIDARIYFSKGNHFKELQDRSIGYVVVPIDSDGEIFLHDRKYSSQVRDSYLHVLDKLTYLKRISAYNNLAVYQFANPSPLFRMIGKGEISFTRITPTKYFVTINNVDRNGRIVFGQNYDSGWEAKSSASSIKSDNFHGFNSFLIQQNGSFGIVVEYGPQKWVYFGSVISVIGILVSLLVLLKK
jgi:hypothetical protein